MTQDGLTEAEREALEEANYAEETRGLGEGHAIFTVVGRIKREAAAKALNDAADECGKQYTTAAWLRDRANDVRGTS